jgi:acyl-CoA synthetase (AMP-forming)/AMP-acid ligase II
LSFGVPDEKYGEEIYAAVVLKAGQQADESELAAYSRSRLGAAGAEAHLFRHQVSAYVEECGRSSEIGRTIRLFLSSLVFCLRQGIQACFPLRGFSRYR